MDLLQSTRDLLQEMGPGLQITRSPYDTAWVARLSEFDEPLGKEALAWLRASQLADGSWGAGELRYHHDRLICTLAAMAVLARHDSAQDRSRLRRASMALDSAIRGLGADPVETIGFEMIAPTLLSDVQEHGWGPTRATDDLSRLVRHRQAKLASLPDGMVNRYVTVAFSAEMVGSDGLHLLDLDNLQEANGSVAYSPAATAFYARVVKPGDEAALGYLRQIAVGGAVPYTAPIDVFEQGWTLWNLALLGKLDKSLEPMCRPHLDFLESQWIPGQGIAAVSNLTLTDGDTTALIFDVLGAYGRPVDVEGVLYYEQDDHFRCFGLEANPSISTNIHVLGALRRVGYGLAHEPVRNILRFLERTQTLQMFWFDKWHASPYYTTAHALVAGVGIMDNLLEDAVYWLLTTQNRDGSWGYYLPTAEETAYCLQALCAWKRHGGRVPGDVLKRGAEWLAAHAEPPYAPLWIGKSLYSPVLVVRSAILSALALVEAD
jgi:halimadienyl-diphosphate synthase